MLIEELEQITENRVVWRRSGNKIKKAVRCTAGPRKGRTVSKASHCGKPIDIKKRFTLKKTRSRFGQRMARKARKTKKLNPVSRRLKSLNR